MSLPFKFSSIYNYEFRCKTPPPPPELNWLEKTLVPRKNFPNYPNVYQIKFLTSNDNKKINDVRVLYYNPEYDCFVFRHLLKNNRCEFSSFQAFSDYIQNFGEIIEKQVCDIRKLEGYASKI